MLWSFHSVLEGFRIWSEGCPCHDCIKQLSKNDQKELAALRKVGILNDGDGLAFVCPLAGLRAPEMAGGEWKGVLANLHAVSIAEVLPLLQVTGAQLAQARRAWEAGGFWGGGLGGGLMRDGDRKGGGVELNGLVFQVFSFSKTNALTLHSGI